MAAAGSAMDPKFVGDRKKDVDMNWAQLVIRVNNLNKSRHQVKVEYPTDSSLVITINGNEIFNKRLPADVVVKDCKHKVSYKDKGEIVVKLRKAQSGKWLDRWSPRRETTSEMIQAITASPLHSQGPIVTEPDDD